MIDYGTNEERQAARRVARACAELNTAIFNASHIGVNCRIVDLHADEWDSHSNLQIQRMERRTMILPAPSDEDASRD